MKGKAGNGERHRTLLDLHQGDFNRGVGTETGGCGSEKALLLPFLGACKERRQAGLQVEGWAKGSVRSVLSGEMERSAAELRGGVRGRLVTRTWSCLTFPHHLLPHRPFLDLIIWLHHL